MSQQLQPAQAPAPAAGYDGSAERIAFSLYPEHIEAVDAVAKTGSSRQTRTRSAALQRIIEDWKQLTGFQTENE